MAAYPYSSLPPHPNPPVTAPARAPTCGSQVGRSSLPPPPPPPPARRERDPTLKIKHDQAGDDPLKLQLEDPLKFPEFILEESETLFEMRLTCNLINYQQFLTLARTLIALLAWVLACHEDPYTLFTVPPLEKGPT